MKLIIQGTLPTLNQIINTSKRNKYAYVKMKNGAIQTVGWSAKACKLSKMPNQYDFSFMWYCPNKATDKDNIIAGQKFVFDGLQEGGYLVNDGWKQIGKITHELFVDKLNPRVEILITEVAG